MPSISDTSDDARRVQYRVLRAMSPARKFALVEDANRTARRLAMAGIAMRHPEAPPEERVRILMDLVLGVELAARVYGPRKVRRREMTALDPEALRVAGFVIEVLERLGIEYHLGGSYAIALHGVPRQTHGIDLVIDPVQGSERAIADSLEDRFYADAASIARAIRERSSCNLIHLDTGIKVDLFVKSPEDTILRKLLWYRLGGRVSERQMEDARGIVGVQGERLDRDYLRRWADTLGVQDLLSDILGGE